MTRKLNASGTCLRYHGTTQLDLVIISIACIFYLLPHGCVYRHPSIDEAHLSVQELTSSLIGDSSPALRLKKCPDRPTPLSTEGSPCQAPARTIPRPSPGAGRFHFTKYTQLLHVTSWSCSLQLQRIQPRYFNFHPTFTVESGPGRVAIKYLCSLT